MTCKFITVIYKTRAKSSNPVLFALNYHRRISIYRLFFTVSLALLTSTLTAFTYQGVIALFVILSIPFAYKYAPNLLNYIKNLFLIGISYGGALLLCMCAFKFWFQGTRINVDIKLLENLKSVIIQLRFVFLYTFAMLPKYFWLGILSFIIAISIILSLTNKHKIQKLLHICVMIIAACVLPTATIIQGSGWMAMRIIYPFASITGTLIIDIYLNNPSYNCKVWKVLDKAVVIAILILLTGQYLAFENIYIDKYKVNFGDELRVDYIGQAIAEYQKRTGNEITQIAFYEDSDMIYPTYPNLYYEGDLVVSSFYADWSRIYSINYYLGTDYIAVESNQKYINYFKQKDWSCLSQEQLIFDGDTLHLCVY